ncbi:MAG: UDP-N-acetylmuramate--L-alanine ligase [Acidimicrobiia bacterium]|nr:MAG: UDP-N-acetylmuramate--L-alanine ligase [Acidimicrobiia bacterium]
MVERVTIPHRVHVIGAGGAGMSGLAKLLSQLGHDVSGSDLKPGRMLDALADVGVESWIGHRPEAMTRVDLVIASSAVPDSDPELVAARSHGVTVWRRPTLLRALTTGRRTIGFAGTHGKTTSTALGVTAMREGIGQDPTFLVGGEMVGLNTGASLGADDVFLLEADEAFGTFRHLSLDAMLVTNIEPDHLDHYGSVAALEDAFAQVAATVDGPTIGCVDDAGVRRLAQRTDITTYGFSQDATWRITSLEHSGGGVGFTLVGPRGSTDVSLRKPGEHLASNAAGVLALLGESGYDVGAASRALEGFAGVRRRYEIRAKVGGVTIVDDYAHHPTEVAATVAAASVGSEGRVIVVFQPHRYTRTADLAPAFGAPLALADTVIVTDVYPAGERPMIGVSGRLVAEATEAAGGNVRFIPRLSDVADVVASDVRPGDILLLLGAGDITSIATDVAKAIEARR